MYSLPAFLYKVHEGMLLVLHYSRLATLQLDTTCSTGNYCHNVDIAHVHVLLYVYMNIHTANSGENHCVLPSPPCIPLVSRTSPLPSAALDISAAEGRGQVLEISIP